MIRDDKTARRRAHMPEGTERIVGARSLHASHKRLNELLTPGMSVLDVGCGNGAITVGMAEKVMPDGRAVGVDVGSRLIEEARRRYGDVEGLTFHVGDAYRLQYESQFDIVTAARVLQWLAKPEDALGSMIKAAVPGGKVIVLDYNHEKIVLDPEPPPAVRLFYEAFLDWRQTAGMDNAIADHLEHMLVEAGLNDVIVADQHEVVHRGDGQFHRSIRIWEMVAATRGKQMVADGVISEKERSDAERQWADWARDGARSQHMYLLAVEGTK